MKTLAFARRGITISGHLVRPACFEERSMLPVSAACLTANAVREKLGEIVGAAVALRLFEPVIPDAQSWDRISDNARIFAFRGTLCDAAFILRRKCALALAGAIFGETEQAPAALSSLEDAMLARAMGALSPALAPVCGEVRERAQPLQRLCGFVTYFEFFVSSPFDARIGVAVSREPCAEAVPAIGAAEIADVKIGLSAEIAHAYVTAESVLALRPGDVLKFNSRLEERAIVRAGGIAIARGECGEIDSRRVAVVQ